MKVCAKCGLEKPETSFSKNVREKDGLKRYCRECVSKESALYRERNGKEISVRKRISYMKSKGRAKERTAKQAMALHKVCTVCNVDKPLSAYYLCGNGGYRSYCISCANARASEYNLRNRMSLVSKKRRYNQMHKSRIDAYNHSYYLAHSDEAKERTKKWVSENPEQAKDNSVIAGGRSRSIRNGVPATYTRREWVFCREWFSVDGHVQCAYCGKKIERATQDHVVPLSHGGEYAIHNIVPACRSCNSSKGNRNMEEWYRQQPFYSCYREQKILTYFEAESRHREGCGSNSLCNA